MNRGMGKWGSGDGGRQKHTPWPLIIIIGSMIFIPQNPKWRSRGRCDGQLWSSLCWKSPGENNFFRTEKKKKIDCWPGPHLLGVEGEGGRRWKRDFLKASSEKLLLLKVNALLTLLLQVYGLRRKSCKATCLCIHSIQKLAPLTEVGMWPLLLSSI